MNQNSDTRILSLFHAGEEDKAMRLLMAEHQEMLYALCKRMCTSHAAADEVLQRAFIKAWKGIGSFQGESHLSSWLYRIASNECLTFLAKQQKTRTEQIDELTIQPRSETHTVRVSDIERGLSLALDTLPPKQRLVFSMRYDQALSYAKMSEISGTSEGALKASYHLAVKKIEYFIREELNLLG